MREGYDSTAHLCMMFTVINGEPRLSNIGIYSAGPEGLTSMGGKHLTFYAEIMRTRGRSYEEAKNDLMANLRSPWWNWVLPYLRN